MTSGQRKMHLLMWLVLGPLAAFGLMLAIDWRPAKPVQDAPLPGVEHTSETADEQPGGRP